MAITRVGGIVNMVPVKNPIYFYYDSTNKNQIGFRYVCRVYKTDNTLLEEIRVPADPSGYGVLQLSKILESFVPGDLDIDNNSIVETVDNHLSFKIGVGESYNYSGWAYSDYEFYGNTSSIFQANVQLRNFSTASTHPFNVGDQINIVQSDGGALKPMLNGLQTVVEVPNNYTIVLGLGWWQVGSGATIGGTVSYADVRKQTTLDMYNDGTYSCVRAAESMLQYNDWDWTDWASNVSTPGEFLTNVPDDFRISSDSEFWLSYYTESPNAHKRVRWKNSNGDEFIATGATSTSLRAVMSVNVGAGITYSVATGSAPLFKNDTEWVEVSIENLSNQTVIQPKRFQIDKRCRIEDAQLLFRDNMGSYLSYLMPLRVDESENTVKKTYNNILGSRGVSGWEYKSSDRGETVYDNIKTTTFTLRSNFLNDAEARYFGELVSSSDVYMLLDGEWVSVVVDTSNWEKKTEFWNKLPRYDVTLRLSNQSPVN